MRTATPAIAAKACRQLVANLLVGGYLEHLLHQWKEAALIGGSADHHPALGPHRRENVAHVRMRGIKDRDRYPLIGDALRYGVHHLFCVAVHRAIDQRHADLARRGGILGPFLVQFHNAQRVVPPDQAVRGCNHRDRQVGQLVDGPQHRPAKEGHDVHIVAQCLALVPGLIGALVVKDCPAQGAITAESVTGKQDLVLNLVGHHRLGPVHHGRRIKAQRVRTQIDAVAIVDDLDAIGNAMERAQHVLRPLRTHDLGLGRNTPDRARHTGVVWLHVVQDHIVQLGQIDDLLDLVKELVRLQRLGQIHDRFLLVIDQIGIVRDALLRDRPQTLKKVGRTVVNANPIDAGFDRYGRHTTLLLFCSLSCTQWVAHAIHGSKALTTRPTACSNSMSIRSGAT